MTAPKAILTEGPVGSTLIRLTWPMLWGMVSMVAFSFADTYFVSQLDVGQAVPRNLAAMTFTFPVVVFVNMLSMGIGIGASSAVSRAIGEGDHHKVQRLTTDSLILSIVGVAILSGIGMVFMDPLFEMLGAGRDVMPLIREYMTVWFLGVVVVLLPMVSNFSIRAAGDTVSPSVIMITAAVINIGLDPILIFGKFGFPAMGLTGAAVATIASRALTLIASLMVLRRKGMLDLTRPAWRVVRKSWGAILYVGLPAAVTNVFFPISLAVVTYLVSGYGESAVAAVGAAGRIEAFAMLVLWSMASSLSAFVGQNWGAEKYGRVHRAQSLSNRFALVYGLVAWGVLAVLAWPLSGLFSELSIVRNAICLYLYIMPAGYGLRGVCFLCSRSFSALNRPLDAMWVDGLRMLIFYVPLALLGNWLLGLPGIFLGMAMSNILAGFFGWQWFHVIRVRLEAKRSAAS